MEARAGNERLSGPMDWHPEVGALVRLALGIGLGISESGARLLEVLLANYGKGGMKPRRLCQRLHYGRDELSERVRELQANLGADVITVERYDMKIQDGGGHAEVSHMYSLSPVGHALLTEVLRLSPRRIGDVFEAVLQRGEIPTTVGGVQ